MDGVKTNTGTGVIMNDYSYDWNFQLPEGMDEWEYYRQQLELVDLEKPDFINENGHRFYQVPNSDGTLYCPDNGQGFIPPAKGRWDYHRDFVRAIINERYDQSLPIIERLKMLINSLKEKEQTKEEELWVDAETRFLEDLIEREENKSMLEVDFNKLGENPVCPSWGSVIITKDGIKTYREK